MAELAKELLDSRYFSRQLAEASQERPLVRRLSRLLARRKQGMPQARWPQDRSPAILRASDRCESNSTWHS